MRVVILGGRGQIGSLIGAALERAGHQAVAVSRATGVDALTGEGLAAALEGADAAIDALNRYTLRRRESVEFFGGAARRIAEAAAAARLPHLVTVSIWNAAHPEARGYGYYAGKAEQERVVEASGVPATIVRSTQWYELAEYLLGAARLGPFAVVPHMLARPAAAAAVADRVAEIAVGAPQPAGAIVAGPERRDLNELAKAIAGHRGERVRILGINPPGMGAFARGVLLPPDEVPGVGPTFEEWLARQ